MITKKSFGVLTLFLLASLFQQLIANPKCLLVLKRGKSKSVCIIGISTNELVIRGRNGIGHSYLKKENRVKNSFYVDVIGMIIKQQMAKANRPFWEEKIDFLFEGKRKNEGVLFPYKLFRFCERQENKNAYFSYKNIWDERVGSLSRFIYDSAEDENKKGKVGGGKEHYTCKKNGQRNTIGDYKGCFVSLKKQYKDALMLLGKKKIAKKSFLLEVQNGLERLISTMNVICKKFGGKKNIFDAIRLMKTNYLIAQVTINLIDDIVHYYCFARYFVQVVSSQFNGEFKRTVIICNATVAEQIGKELFDLGYENGGKLFARPKEQKMGRKGKLLEVFSDQEVKTVINYSLGCCNWCGARNVKINRCSACKIPFYCSKDCQTRDWNNHKDFCKMVGRKDEDTEKKNVVVKKKKRQEEPEQEKGIGNSSIKQILKSFDDATKIPDNFCFMCGYQTNDGEDFLTHKPRDKDGMEQKDAKPCMGL